MADTSDDRPRLDEARRHFLGLATAAGARIGAACLIIPSFCSAASANNGLGRGPGGPPPGAGQGPRCFLPGTRLMTPEGDKPIEDIEIGDQVTTGAGASAPVKWIARRAYERNAGGWSKSVAPIHIKRGAIADNVPARDLHVSPAHRLYIDGYFVEAQDLVNGGSVQRETPATDRIEYFHVLFDRHEIVFAEGAPSASLQLGPNGHKAFANAMEYERIYGCPSNGMPPCAPTLGVGGKEHLKALLRLGASPFVRLDDPLSDIRRKIAARSESRAVAD